MKGFSGVIVVNEKEKKQNECNDCSGLQWVVFVKIGGIVKMVLVEMGIVDMMYFEIKLGFVVGDEVVSGSYVVFMCIFVDGMKVEMELLKVGGVGFLVK